MGVSRPVKRVSHGRTRRPNHRARDKITSAVSKEAADVTKNIK
jgi:hypothetical protein